MRGIGRELAFTRERVAHAFEQVVECRHQAMDLARRTAVVDRIECEGCARRHFARDVLQWRQRTPDHGPDQQGQNR